MSNNKYIFKRGGVFTFTFRLLNLDLNTPITDLTNIECSSSIETPTGRLIANLTVTPLGDGKLLFSSVGDTSGWATGDAVTDVKVVIGGQPVYTQTFEFEIKRSIS